ncbi:unnamed protein product [Arctia plantaginis]|uniref:Uncharacterized protein n=1 Tax=Arctia plantaginis TaxID=874455 RepID=A0A8S0YRC1_ARCPL|nr:unnamed protein product [Arctia plantaginis]
MRRTYGSKKDTTNVIERRDLLQNLNENGAVYDAFSIQNIRQTKRELSCVGSSNTLGVASCKVRKKKFVKRIVKEAEIPCRENTSTSCYLTPDRSLRVNKPLDPFDLLLMSSPARPVQSSSSKVESVTGKVKAFDQLIPKKEGRTYTRRKPRKVKKFNYSSTDSSSDSDKENVADSTNITGNTSDIRSHKLQVEPVVNITPKMIDDSINNIVNNLSLLNKLKHKYSMNDSNNKSFKYRNHRLTKNLLSPLLQKSPLCSTPFKVKYRGESIFKFSPIAATNKDCSPKHGTLVENNDDSNCSVILLSKPKLDSPKLKENPQNSESEHNIDEEVDNEIKHPQRESDIEVDKSLEVQETSKIISNDTNTISTVEISSLQTTEIEPLLGFPIDANKKAEDKNENHVISIPHTDDTFDKSSVIDTELSANKADLEERSINNSNDCSIAEIEIAENQSYGDKTNVSNDIENKSDDNTIQHSIDEDENSLYDTCPSEQSSIQTSDDKKQPVILLQRMDESLFFKYYHKMKCEEENSDSNSINYEHDYKDCNDSKKSFNSTDLESDLEENELENKTDNSDVEIELKYDRDDDSEEEKCMSFVTTRRRNEVTSNSRMSIFNESNYSSSTDCDKTVLSNKEIEKPDDNSYIDNKEILVNLESNNADATLDPNKSSEHLDETVLEQETGMSFVTTRSSNMTERRSAIRGKKSSINPQNSRVSDRQSDLHTGSLTQESDMSRFSCLDSKPCIVLQPGKRWERSLSIYRRMTMMTDHFDRSILEEEATSAKGRKYRQSVISTMEMQEFNSK